MVLKVRTLQNVYLVECPLPPLPPPMVTSLFTLWFLLLVSLFAQMSKICVHFLSPFFYKMYHTVVLHIVFFQLTAYLETTPHQFFLTLLSLSFISVLYFTVRNCHFMFDHSSTCKYLGCLLAFAVTNKEAMNNLCTHIFFS